MQFVDTESQSLVGMVIVVDAIVTELLTPYLRSLAPDARQAAIARITEQVTANGKHIVDMAPQAMVGSANKIQAAASRLADSAIKDAMAEIAKT